MLGTYIVLYRDWPAIDSAVPLFSRPKPLKDLGLCKENRGIDQRVEGIEMCIF